MEKKPTVFISYSWSSEEHKEKVKKLAEQLVANGIDVVIDIWNLHPGHDKYSYMERCVNDPLITSVLIICDKQYSEKANKRVGGVGDETSIITSYLYGQNTQEKFIPVIFEFDEFGQAYLPDYLKPRMYIDMANNDSYQSNFDYLVKCIYKAGDFPTKQLPTREIIESVIAVSESSTTSKANSASTSKKEEASTGKKITAIIAVIAGVATILSTTVALLSYFGFSPFDKPKPPSSSYNDDSHSDIVSSQIVSPISDDITERLTLAEVYNLVQNGEYSKAVKLCNDILGYNSANYDAHYNRGIANYYLGNYEDAIDDYTAAIANFPQFDAAYNNRGFVKEHILEEYDDAIGDYTKAIEISQNDPLYYYNRGSAYLKSHDFENALADFDMTLSINPNYEDALAGKDLCLESMQA